MKKEHYIKVHIKSESDLPEVNRDYIVHFKSSIGTGVNISLFRFEKFSRDTWINSFDWYLKPAEPAKGLTDERTSKLEELVGLYGELISFSEFGITLDMIGRKAFLKKQISELRKELSLT